MNIKGGNYFRELDCYRGLLSMGVVLYHVGLNTAIAKFAKLDGYSAPWGLIVDIFFVVSGFVIANAYYERRYTPLKILKLRALRLYPLYWFTSFCAVLASRGEVFSFPRAAANVTMLPQFLGESFYNGSAWSISYELVVPTMISVVYFFCSMDRNSASANYAFLSIFILSIPMAFLPQLSSGIGPLNGFARSFFGIFAGVVAKLVYDLAKEKKQLVQLIPNWSGSLFIGISLLLILFLGPKGQPYLTRSLLAWLFYVSSFCAVVFSALSSHRGEPFILTNNNVLHYLGKISFSIYLLHVPVLILFSNLFGQSFDGSVARKGFYVISVVLLSCLTYEYFERPANLALRKIQL